MALDKDLVQNINLRVADTRQLVDPLNALGRQINKLVADLEKVPTRMTRGSEATQQSLNQQLKQLRQLVSSAKTLQDLLTGSTSKGKNNILSVLDEQSLGKKAVSAAALRRELGQTTKSADALDVRLAQLYKRFNDLTEAGRKVGKNDLGKAFNTAEAIKQVRQLEAQIAKLDARGASGPGSTKVRGDLQTAQDRLLSAIQNPRRVNWTTEIAQIAALVDQYRSLTKAELDAATAAERLAARTRASLFQNAGLSESQLRAQLQRQSSQYSFTPDQARTLRGTNLNGQVDSGIARLQQLQQLINRAAETGRSQAVIDRLAKSWSGLSEKIAETIAQQRAFNALPEVRAGNLLSSLFGAGNLGATIGRVAGFSAISTGVYGLVNAVQSGLQNIAQLEDALAKLQAISGATDIEMKKMSASILEVANSSRYSTVEITESATQIAQAGFSAQETSQVLRDALTLAQASGSSPTEAVDTLTSALGAFQLQASESTRVVDTLVEGLNRSKLSITQMQQAIQYAGSTASESGVKFEELTAVAASIANAGVRSGSTIGTGLRQLLVDLKTPTKEFQAELKSLGLTMADVDVKSNGLAGVVKKLTDAGFSAESAYNSFEVRAASAFLAFRNQIGVYDQLAQSLATSGAAQEAAGRASESLSAKWQILLNNLTSLVSGLSGPFLDAAKGGVVVITELVSVLSQLNEATNGVVGRFLAVGAAMAAGNAVAGPLGAAIGALATVTLMLIGSMDGAAGSTEKFVAASNEAKQALDSKTQTVTAVDAAIRDLITREDTLRRSSPAVATETITLTNRFEGLSTQLSGTALNYDNLIAAMRRYRGEALREAAEAARATQIAAQDEAGAYSAQIRKNNQDINFLLARKNRPGNITPDEQRAAGAFDYARRTAGTDFSQLSVSTLTSAAIDTQAQLNNLRSLRSNNSYVKELITTLQKRLDLINQLRDAKSRVETAETQVGLYNERVSKRGQERDNFASETQRGVDHGLKANQKAAGSGDTQLNRVVAQANARIAALQQEVSQLDQKSPRALAIQGTIQELQSQVARVTTIREADLRDRRKTRGAQDKPGLRLTADEVGDEIKRRLPEARITDTTRSVGQQAAFDRAGGIKRNPATAPHVSGNALDMAPIPGMDPSEIAAILEDMGLVVTAGPIKAPGVRYVTPNHGTGKHWHWEWKAAPTKAEKKAQTDAEQKARELQQLLEKEASYSGETQAKRITRLTNEAKAGSRPVGDLTTEFTDATEQYRKEMLRAFDVANPTKDLSPEALKARALARKQLEEKLGEDIGNYYAQFYRQIADTAENALDAALAASQRAFEENKIVAEAPIRNAQSDATALGNRTNRNRFGAGAAYRQQRNEEQAQLRSDQSLLGAYDQQIGANQLAIGTYQVQIASAPAGEDKDAKVRKLAEATAELNKLLQERAELQQKVNDVTRALDEGPLSQRLRDSAQAWMENSGALDSWSKVAEDSVGPLLDNLTDGMTDAFTSITDGTKSVVGALGDMVASFAKAVQQMIMRALALKAVKTLLSAVGFGGAYEGGPVEPQPRYNGGPTIRGLQGGGQVTTGVSNRDSSLYNLAHGEWVIRGQSVREIGAPAMNLINKEGAKGLAKLGAAGTRFTAVQAPKQETNVFVVQERQAPPMGPNDVLVTVHEDILQGGATKKLIRQVAQGG